MARTVLGVDLGTTNTVVAVFDGATMKVVADEAGEHVTPSVVSFHPNGKVLVGNGARERRVVDAENTVFSVKRLIGRPFEAPEVRAAARRLPFELRGSESGGVVVRTRDQTYSLPEISAFVLRRVRQLCTAALGERPDNAIVTVPASFNELQRTATRDAGRIAGLNVLRILNEPTAAALAYGFSGHEGERIAVYDFGGGTFDISILELGGDVIEVIATAGDSALGGDDVDALIADRMAEAFLKRERVDLRGDRVGFERLRQAAEWLKRQLSYLDHAEVQIEAIAHGGKGRVLDLRHEMTRDELAELMAPITARSFQICERAMASARVRPTQLDAVILVGGQTRSPTVVDQVREYFGREPLRELDPDQVVAMGAAIHGYTLLGGVAKRQWTTVSVGGPKQSAAPPPTERKVYGFDEEPTRLADIEPLSAPVPRVVQPPPTPGGEATVVKLPPDAADATRVAPPPVELTHASVPSSAEEPTRVTGPPAGLMREPLPLAARAEEEDDDALTRVFIPEEERRPSRPPPARRSAPPSAPLPAHTPSPAAAPRPPSVPSTPTLRGVGASAPPSGRARKPSTPTLRPAGSSVPPPAAAPSSGLPPPAARPSASPPARASVPPAPVMPRAAPTPPAPSAPPRASSSPSPSRRSEPGTRSAPPRASSAPPQARGAPPAPDVPPRASSSPSPARSEPGTRGAPSRASAPSPVLSESLPELPAKLPGPPAVPRSSVPAPAPSSEPPLRMAPRPSRAPPAPEAGPAIDVVVEPPRSTPPPPRPVTASERPAPLLLDVTPHTLAVETVGGYCEQVIEQNAPIPTEQTRLFSTSQDNQSRVSVRVCQGEDRRMEENQILGAVELMGLPPGPRGHVKIAVTFELDSDGTLHVRARDQASGKAQAIRINLVGALDSASVERLRARQDALVVEA